MFIVVAKALLWFTLKISPHREDFSLLLKGNSALGYWGLLSHFSIDLRGDQSISIRTISHLRVLEGWWHDSDNRWQTDLNEVTGKTENHMQVSLNNPVFPQFFTVSTYSFTGIIIKCVRQNNGVPKMSIPEAQPSECIILLGNQNFVHETHLKTWGRGNYQDYVRRQPLQAVSFQSLHFAVIVAGRESLLCLVIYILLLFSIWNFLRLKC